LGDRLAARIRRQGPLPFDAFLELALYDPDGGFFATGHGAGRGGADFLTSPEVGPLFGAVLAGAVDDWWEELGRPDPFIVVEAGAGVGTLARDVVAAAPQCAGSLRYVLVERSATLRARQAERLALAEPSQVLGPTATVSEEDDDESPVPIPGAGPLLTSLAHLPAGPINGVVLANELLDNLPFVLVERHRGEWAEVRVGLDGEVLVAASPVLAEEAERLAPLAPDGGRLPLQHRAAAWLRDALGVLARGRVVVIDYASTSAELAQRPWTQWLRTYRSHGQGRHPLHNPGGQDVTCEVAIDQLVRVRRPVSDQDQATFLRQHGIDHLVDEARAAWRARAPIGDLEALRAQSRLVEARALTDPAGPGAFRVLEWRVGGP
jgi:SAM-dependent MidA family methyltransferase